MPGLRFLTAGESHGPGLTVILEGLPAGLRIAAEDVDRDLQRRQLGYGRGGRMAIERDRVAIRGGVRHGSTLGGPVALWIENLDFARWTETMAAEPRVAADPRRLTRPRPGHADLAGCRKLGIDDARPVLERASARETAARVAAGALARALLRELGIEIGSHVLSVGTVVAAEPGEVLWSRVAAIPDDSSLRMVEPAAEALARSEIDRATEDGDTVGGRVEVIAHTPPPGLGHFIQWDLRLDGRIGQAILSIPAVKAVAIGAGFAIDHRRGSEAHDIIRAGAGGQLVRPTNRAGGIEGGMTNGEEVRVTLVLKPISTLRRPLESVDLESGERSDAAYERSDVAVVPAAGVVAEAMLALVLADAALDKFGGDSLGETLRNARSWGDTAGWPRP